MSNQIFVEVDDRALLASIHRAIEAVDDMPRVLGNIGEYLVQSTQDRFATQASPDGTAWPALSPSYLRRKQKKYPGKSMLRREDRLYDSIVWQVADDTLLVGSNVKYAAIHQFGGKIHHAAYSRVRDRATIRAHEAIMPARPFLGLSRADRDEISAITLDYLQEAIDGA